MSLVKWGFIALLLLPAAEIAAFIIVAVVIGWLWALCLFVATTVLGVLVLKRAGRKDVDRLRAALARDGVAAIHLDSPGLGPVIGGILLLLPGFITDMMGAALLIPAVRRRLRGAISRARPMGRRQRAPAVVDLTPEEWHQVSDKAVEDRDPRRPAK